MHILKNKFSVLFVLAGILLVCWLTNACKKQDEQASITTFLTGYGSWQLASLQRYNYSGDTLKTTDTLNTACMYTQTVNFNDAGTYMYNHFNCATDLKNGNWHFSTDKLVLLSATQFKVDTGLVMPFKYARIVNLGRNSLVLQQTDTPTKYQSSTVKKYTVMRYGFIHIAD
ncbi:hypothetical protein HH214_03090 [Mucilaginibacter robiniae]|uniref:Lipocalin-like domain-containing protein n=1 Tax=Mucilaginibacter robiniae TaxID=2728022 RepID=A0A7L5E3M8_9SPHI|nr:hypothetical protein [Mucilaginibacter robiniae]QJD94936.1 hypothetical protein HH214_03090 [Mucilaginibacter robiniae]